MTRRTDWGSGGKGAENSLPNSLFLPPFLRYTDRCVNSISPSEVSSVNQLPFPLRLHGTAPRHRVPECTDCLSGNWLAINSCLASTAELCTYRSLSDGTPRFRAFCDYRMQSIPSGDPCSARACSRLGPKRFLLQNVAALAQFPFFVPFAW